MSLTLCLHASATAPWAYLLRGNAVAAEAGGPGDPAAGATLADLTRRALDRIPADAADIARIVVDIGPGRLSAVRAAVSFANALAFARDLPIAPVLSSAAAGMQAERATGGPALIVHKSAGGTAYVARYRGRLETLAHGPLGDTLARLGAGLDACTLVGLDPDAAAPHLPGVDIVAGGDGTVVATTFLTLAADAAYTAGPLQPVTEQSDLIDA